MDTLFFLSLVMWCLFPVLAVVLVLVLKKKKIRRKKLAHRKQQVMSNEYRTATEPATDLNISSNKPAPKLPSPPC
ncbi:unnamed protein product, partial [Mesorhabditis spiculigera]